MASQKGYDRSHERSTRRCETRYAAAVRIQKRGILAIGVFLSMIMSIVNSMHLFVWYNGSSCANSQQGKVCSFVNVM